MHLASKLCGVAVSLVALVGGAQTTTTVAYDVISIKPNKTLSHSVNISWGDGKYMASNVSLKSLIREAYDLKTNAQLSGLPGWADSASFDIEAKEDPEMIAAMKDKPKKEQWEYQLGLMRSLLADRFHLVVHHESKILPTYSLVVAKGGVKFKESAADNPKSGSTMINNTKMTAIGVTMEDLSTTLSGQVDRQVIDKTELKAKYDVQLEWSRGDAPVESKDTAGVDSAPTIFTAVQEQLGLKLESSKGPVDTIVVEHIEQPSEN